MTFRVNFSSYYGGYPQYSSNKPPQEPKETPQEPKETPQEPPKMKKVASEEGLVETLKNVPVENIKIDFSIYS